MLRLPTAILAILLPLAAGAQTPGADFRGRTFTIISARGAPWASRDYRPDIRERDYLVGKTIAFGSGAIAGPPQLACKAARYEVATVGADALFQGGLDPKTADRDSVALGFRPGPIATLSTGCEIDFHFLTPTRAVFALNNNLYFIDIDPRSGSK